MKVFVFWKILKRGLKYKICDFSIKEKNTLRLSHVSVSTFHYKIVYIDYFIRFSIGGYIFMARKHRYSE